MRRFTLEPDEPPEGGDRNLTLDYEAALNPQQYAAATAGGGPVLVAAGAGTGKTRTLIYRLAYLVETGTRPQEIVLLTFTRRAAREMTARAADLLDGRCRNVRGGTFHAFCLQILRRHAPKLGFHRSFTILDASDAGDVWGVLRTRKNYHKGEKRFPNKRTLQNISSKATNRGLALEKLLNDEYPQFAAFGDEIRQLRGDYRQYKQQHDLMDFDDLLLHTLRLCEESDSAGKDSAGKDSAGKNSAGKNSAGKNSAGKNSVRKQIAAECKHVLVDEYQDTNVLQADLVKHFAGVHGNVMVVGDDAQSIYRFRGADFRNIFRFPDEHKGTRVLKLEQNYRSTQPILDLANHVIGQASRSYDKELFSKDSAANNESEADLPALVPAPDDHTESRFVTQMVLQLREQGVPLNRLAVLFRSGYNSYDLETELNRCGVPFVKYGGMKLNEAAHIKDLLAHLKVLENVQDAASWNRILQLLHGIGPKTARDLIEWLTGEDAAHEPYTLSSDDWSHSSRYVEALKKLFATLRSIYDDDVPLVEQVEALVSYYEPIMEEKYHEDFPKRQPDLDHFVALADNFSDRTDFLASLALDPIELTALGAEPLEDDEAPLVLSTIHSAKGLEFHTVFLIQALEGVLPSGYSLGDADALDEELRLLYVAVTRAEENLFVSYPMTSYQRRSGEYLTDPSRFLDSVPDEILEPCRLVQGDPPDEDAEDHAPSADDGTPLRDGAIGGDGAASGNDQLPF